MTTRRFEFVEGASKKFWEFTESGTSLTMRFGRIGTAGQSQTKEYPSVEAARAVAEKLVTEKTGNGYVEVSLSSPSSEATAPVHARDSSSVSATVNDEPARVPPRTAGQETRTARPTPTRALKVVETRDEARGMEGRDLVFVGLKGEIWAATLEISNPFGPPNNLLIWEKATPTALQTVLASEFAGRAESLMLDFSPYYRHPIRALPADLSTLTRVKRAEIKSVAVGGSIWTLPSIESLDLWRVGNIAPPPHAIETLRHLKITGYGVRTLPEGIDRATNLTSLTLLEVSLKELPAWIGRLPRLESLTIRCGIRPKSFPPEGSLPSLENLVLSWPEIEKTRFPAWLAELRGRLATHSASA